MKIRNDKEQRLLDASLTSCKSQHTPNPHPEGHMDNCACEWCKPKIEHTPTPWKYEGLGMFTDSTGHLISFDMRTTQGKEDAAFIVRAVNFNQVLINIAKNSHGVLAKHIQPNPDCETCLTIAKAEGK